MTGFISPTVIYIIHIRSNVVIALIYNYIFNVYCSTRYKSVFNIRNYMGIKTGSELIKMCFLTLVHLSYKNVTILRNSAS